MDTRVFTDRHRPRFRRIPGLILGVLGAALFLLLAGPPDAGAQGFLTGSSGRRGNLVVGDGVTTNIVVPDDGILDYADIVIGTNALVQFQPNANNTPVYLLATGDVVIAGTVRLDGADGSNSAGGAGGPGGFDGGLPGFGGLPAGGGLGPGGGLPGPNPIAGTTNSAGAGAHATRPSPAQGRSGNAYGSPLLLPLVGGSGGAGGVARSATSPGWGGGGGGGALLVASPNRIAFVGPGTIQARGGSGGPNGGGGSGGSVRLVAPRVSAPRPVGASYRIETASPYGGGDGRIRIDSITDRGAILLNTLFTGSNGGAPVLGSFLFTGITNAPQRFLLPRVDVVRAAGRDIPVGTASPVTVQLPFNGASNQIVSVQVSGFPVSVFPADIPVQVAVIPESGTPAFYSGLVNHRPGGGRGTVDVGVVIPLNTVCHIQAWTAN